MRTRLLELLRCPACSGRLSAVAFVEAGRNEELAEGVLLCGCGVSYPVVNTIPRMLENAYELFPSFVERYRDRPELRLRASRGLVTSALPEFERAILRTRESFGYQWTTFSEMACDFRENFWNYIHPATPEFLKGRLGLDVGCGFGRHIYHAAECGAEMVGMDLSSAIDATRANTAQFPNVHLVQADIYAMPFSPETFDFVYSIGVLHHLPDPERGFRALVPLIRREGSLFVWLYSKSRRASNFLVECVRAVTTKLPHGALRVLSLLGACVDFGALILPYRALRRVPGLGSLVDSAAPPRVKVYNRYPFQVLQADWFDRLAAPIRFYYNENEVRQLLTDAGLSDIRVAPTGLYGWRGCGVKPRSTQP